MEPPSLWFANICRKNGLILTDHQVRLFEHYVELLLDWNRKINLVSRKDEDQIWANHILHSVSILFKLRLCVGEPILDLGTGGGLPGIPLKILLPDSPIILLDATHKKVEAIRDMVQRLELSGAQALWGRAEDLAKDPNLVSQIGYIVARAVAPLKDLIAWSMPFARRSVSDNVNLSTQNQIVRPPAIIALKGGVLEREVEEAKRRTLIRRVDIMNLAFDGAEEFLAADKKIVVVRL